MSLELPATREVRRRIENVFEEPYRNALKFAWLGLCRASEVCGEAYKSDTKTTPRGPTGDSFELTEYRNKDDDKVPVVIFNVSTSKRGGLPRSVAYPLLPEYEPWAVELRYYFEEFSPNQKVFPFTRQVLYRAAHNAFEGLTYPIEEYTRIIEEHELKEGMQIIRDNEEGLIVKLSKHYRDMATHAIRHIKAVDLMNIHGFTVQELSVIGGWTLRSMTGASGAISRYAHLDWQSYFPKLLIKRHSREELIKKWAVN